MNILAKILLIINLLILSKVICAQASPSKYSKVYFIKYDYLNDIKETMVDSVSNISEIDIKFLIKRFHFIPISPDSLKSSKKGGDTIKHISNPDSPYHRITVEIIYDKDGYLSRYYRSSCMACSFELIDY